MTIFRMVRALSLKGHRQTIWLHGPQLHKSGTSTAFDDIIKHYQTVNADVRRVDEPEFKKIKGDAVIATDWGSVYPARSIEQVKRCFYFVQDLEATFVPRGAESLLAESTYNMDVDCLCASPWLAQTMEAQYGRWSRYFHLAADREIYAPATDGKLVQPELPRIAFYARTHTARRVVELGLLALEILAGRGHRFVVDFFGTDKPIDHAPFAFIDHGIISPQRLAALYQDATIGVVFSATNYSLVPQEMMACGLPVIELDVESTRAIYPLGVVSKAAPDPFAIADAMEELLADTDKRQLQRETALSWVEQFSWRGQPMQLKRALLIASVS